MDSVENLMKLNQNIWKIPSGEITNLPYLEIISKYKVENKKIILSTGMATIEEIENAVEILNPLDNEIIILHCNTEYPSPDVDINISAIKELQETFPKNTIGFSDHSIGSTAAIMSVALGAKMIEKHFTLNKELPGPDHHASATPEELVSLVNEVRRAELMYEIVKKELLIQKEKNIIVARKSIVANKRIKAGDVFTSENITVKRPGNGISPLKWYDVLGLVSEKDFEEDELIVDSRFHMELTNE